MLQKAVIAGCCGSQSSRVPAAITQLPDIVVVGEWRSPEQSGEPEWQRTDFDRANQMTLDAVLASDPSFSLYRRQSSLFGNPTSAGVSLRHTGATAAARTGVIRDGIPQNDPFGGWVSWARYDSDFIESVRLEPAARACVWGNQSPAGTLYLTSSVPERVAGHLRTTIGSHRTSAVSTGLDFVSESGKFALQANVFALLSDGFYTIAASQRGGIDRPLDIDTRGIDLRAIWRPSKAVTIDSALSGFREARGDGTPLAGNESRAFDASLRATVDTEDGIWQALAYFQQRDYSAMFTSVSDDRNSEFPALRQFDVPGAGIGGSLTITRQINDRFRFIAGGNVRHLTGETNEDASFLNGVYRRRRKAGGEETFAGLFARATMNVDNRTKIDASARVEGWGLTNGLRLERDPVTNALLRSDRYPSREAINPSFGVTVSRKTIPNLELSVSCSNSFRAPTLNELYRPFRVRNDITESNPSLDAERFLSFDAGADWSPRPDVQIKNTIFVHRIQGAIANVPLTSPEQGVDLDTPIPVNGTLVQRQNVDQARVAGLESRIKWSPMSSVSVSLAYQFTATRFTKSSRQSLLKGRAFPQSPAHQLIASAVLKPAKYLEFQLLCGFTGTAFDDALGLRSLRSCWTTSIGAALEIRKDLTLRARVENVFDKEIQTGLSSAGLVSTGLPRTFWLTTEYRW